MEEQQKRATGRERGRQLDMILDMLATQAKRGASEKELQASALVWIREHPASREEISLVLARTLRALSAVGPGLTISQAQSEQSWATVGHNTYDRGEPADMDGRHALFHIMRATGRLAEIFEAQDHSDAPLEDSNRLGVIKSMSADLMACALRLANLYDFHLEAELQRRVSEKSGDLRSHE